jgi:hypothetical protein
MIQQIGISRKSLDNFRIPGYGLTIVVKAGDGLAFAGARPRCLEAARPDGRRSEGKSSLSL